MLVCNSSTQEEEAGGARDEGHSQLHNILDVSLGYVTPCLKEIENKKKQTVSDGEGRPVTQHR